MEKKVQRMGILENRGKLLAVSKILFSIIFQHFINFEPANFFEILFVFLINIVLT